MKDRFISIYNNLMQRRPWHEAEKREKGRSPFVLQNEAKCFLRPVRVTAGVEFIDESGGGPRCPVVKTICDYRYGKALTAMRFMNSKPVSSSSDGDSRAAASAPRLLYVVSEDWYFLSHRLPMARAARDAGFEVHVATNVKDGAAAIEAERFILHPIPFARGRLSPRASLATIMALRRIHRLVAPAVTHHVSLQPSVLGLIAALGRPTAYVNALTGLGYTFTSASLQAKAIGWSMSAVLRPLLDREQVINLVQNDDDRMALMALGVTPSRIALIAGSGVDVVRLQAAARTGRSADRRVRRPAPRRQGDPHAHRSAEDSARARLDRRSC